MSIERIRMVYDTLYEDVYYNIKIITEYILNNYKNH